MTAPPWVRMDWSDQYTAGVAKLARVRSGADAVRPGGRRGRGGARGKGFQAAEEVAGARAAVVGPAPAVGGPVGAVEVAALPVPLALHKHAAVVADGPDEGGVDDGALVVAVDDQVAGVG